MKFICSINSVVAKHVDAITGKIEAKGNFTSFNENWEALEASTEELAAHLKQKSGLCAWHLHEGKRKANRTGVIKAGLIIVDIDNQADHKDRDGNKVQKQELTVEEALELDICKKYLTIAYYSPSTSEGWPRFRLVFGLEKPIIDANFYQWFSKEIYKQIPGSDVRATTIPNLFYGPKKETDLICTPGRFIPAKKTDDALRFFATLPVKSTDEGDETIEILKSAQVSPRGIDLTSLVSHTVRSVLDGEEVLDRSSTMASVAKELVGWVNWLNERKIAVRVSPLTTAQDAFYNIYEYHHDENGKFYRILSSVRDTASLLPAISLASELGPLAIWKKVKSVSRSTFDRYATDEDKEKLASARKKQINSVLDASVFELSTSTQVEDTSNQTQSNLTQMKTPDSPKELVDLQGGGSANQKVTENTIADTLISNLGGNLLYDNTLDQFYRYDQELGVWYLYDEQHTRLYITDCLDIVVKAGLLSRYTAATVSSIYQLLKPKLLKSVRNGRESIWTTSKNVVPFSNGVLDLKTLEFKEGLHKELYLRHKLGYEYVEKSSCPKFLTWLKKALDPGQDILIQAFCRAILTGYTSGERFLHLVGPGGTGKSTMQQLLVALAGFHSTHTSSLQTLHDNQFETFNLIGKRLLLLTDESNYNKRMDTLKKLTSASDTLRAERKYGKEIINFKPECLVCIASNEHISSSDSTSGLERRRLTIVMDKVVPASSRVELISVHDDRIEGEFMPELSGIVSWALKMTHEEMRDVLANPSKHAPSINKTNIEALVFNSQFAAWLADCTLYAPNSVTPIGRGALTPNTDEKEKGWFVSNAYGALYPSYVNFCKACQYKPAAKPRFVERTREVLTNMLKVPGIELVLNDGIPSLKGLRLKAFDLNSDRASKGPERLPSPVEFAQNPGTTKWETAFKKHDPAPES
jgi:P4 family phage/plasmid primase-like protien